MKEVYGKVNKKFELFLKRFSRCEYDEVLQREE